MNYPLSISLFVALCGMFVTCLPVDDYLNIGNMQNLYRVDQRSFGNIIAKRQLGEIPAFDDDGDYYALVM